MKNNERNVLILVIIGIIVVFGGLIIAKKYASKSIADGRKIFFYSTTCPHCLNVEKFIADNKVEEKFKFEKLEVGASQDNALLMINYAKKCGLAENEAYSVPQFWDGAKGDCYAGEQEIEAFLKTKI